MQSLGWLPAYSPLTECSLLDDVLHLLTPANSVTSPNCTLKSLVLGGVFPKLGGGRGGAVIARMKKGKVYKLFVKPSS